MRSYKNDLETSGTQHVVGYTARFIQSSKDEIRKTAESWHYFLDVCLKENSIFFSPYKKLYLKKGQNALYLYWKKLATKKIKINKID